MRWQEFIDALPMLNKWGVDLTEEEAEAEFNRIDKNGEQTTRSLVCAQCLVNADENVGCTRGEMKQSCKESTDRETNRKVRVARS